MAASSPMAVMMVTNKSLPSSKAVWMLSPNSPSGALTSSLVSPSLSIKDKKPSSMSNNWYSVLLTNGTSMLWVDGDKSSNFLEVKISVATKWTLA
ncbi:hypothetical protein WICPIJ_002774 [Wickerhamomyces pijperi]|uniref:Uncharacterized protein n=1 Tax=Wickerhamomyces pijperi TaxID=599730 RepID=A0A9P8QB33_WICPI|nr:hypothetical protein WICPIJ_002774 [Wickerhamomyces pijperi]